MSLVQWRGRPMLVSLVPLLCSLLPSASAEDVTPLISGVPSDPIDFAGRIAVPYIMAIHLHSRVDCQTTTLNNGELANFGLSLEFPQDNTLPRSCRSFRDGVCSTDAPTGFVNETMELFVQVINSDEIPNPEGIVLTCTETQPRHLEDRLPAGPFNVSKSESLHFLYKSKQQYSLVHCGSNKQSIHVLVGYYGVGADKYEPFNRLSSLKRVPEEGMSLAVSVTLASRVPTVQEDEAGVYLTNVQEDEVGVYITCTERPPSNLTIEEAKVPSVPFSVNGPWLQELLTLKIATVFDDPQIEDMAIITCSAEQGSSLRVRIHQGSPFQPSLCERSYAVCPGLLSRGGPDLFVEVSSDVTVREEKVTVLCDWEPPKMLENGKSSDPIDLLPLGSIAFLYLTKEPNSHVVCSLEGLPPTVDFSSNHALFGFTLYDTHNNELGFAWGESWGGDAVTGTVEAHQKGVPLIVSLEEPTRSSDASSTALENSLSIRCIETKIPVVQLQLGVPSESFALDEMSSRLFAMNLNHCEGKIGFNCSLASSGILPVRVKQGARARTCWEASIYDNSCQKVYVLDDSDDTVILEARNYESAIVSNISLSCTQTDPYPNDDEALIPCESKEGEAMESDLTEQEEAEHEQEHPELSQGSDLRGEEEEEEQQDNLEPSQAWLAGLALEIPLIFVWLVAANLV